MSEETVHESSSELSRAEIASHLRRVADALDDGEPVPVGEAGETTVEPPEDAELEVELEREGEHLTLEFEVAWPEGEGGVDAEAAGSAATFELYEDTAGQWRWRLRHDNGNIVADSGEGYQRRVDAENGIESVRRNAPGAPVEERD